MDGCRLGLDIRATQNPRYADRGVGRYVAELALALERVAPGAVDAFMTSVEPDALMPPPSVAGLTRLVPRDASAADGWSRGRVVFHAMSPFEDGPLEDVWPRGMRRRDAALVVTAFDLIPLVFAEHYLRDALTHRQYMNRCNLLRAADVILAISQATADDVVRLLGVPESRVVVIGGGVGPWFNPGTEGQAAIIERVAGTVPGLSPGFLMYTGGIDYRKNVDGALEAYSLLAPDLRRDHQLVITCSVTADERSALLARASELRVAEQVLVTGYVPDQVLRDLYRSCELFVFPSIYEGFGLPVAEARACGAPVIVGDNSSLRELVPNPAARFDASDPRAIADRIDRVLRDEAFKEQLRVEARSQNLTWDRVASKALNGYERAASIVERRSRRPVRPRLALVTPWPPQLSGIADYAHMLVPHLSERFDVDVVVDGDPSGFARSEAAPVRLVPLDGFDMSSQWRRYDRIIYQIGNSEYHAHAIDMLKRVPGEVIAHDVRLTGLYWWRGHHTSGESIAAELARMYGSQLPQELEGAPHVTGGDADRLGIWMLRDVIEYGTRVWVHSGVARDAVRAEAHRFGMECDVRLLPFGYPPVSHSEVAPAPRAPSPVMTSFGVMGPSKGCDVLIRALAAVRLAVPGTRLVFAGPVEPAYQRQMEAIAGAEGVRGAVTFTGALDVEDYEAAWRSASVAVQLRATTNGEGSLTVAEALAKGTPAVVTDLGWMGELPPGVVVPLPSGASPAHVARVLVNVLTDDDRRRDLQTAGRAHAAANGFDRTARVLLEAVSPAG